MQHGEPQPFYEEIQLSGIGYAAFPHVEKESSHLRSSYGMPALAFYKAVN